MPNLERFKVAWEKTCWTCGVGSLDFQCTDELTPLDHFIGQDRALQALRFGLEIEKPGYNLFVTGLTGTGKASAIKAHLEIISKELSQRSNQTPLNDWCYVHNFEDPDIPNAVSVPRGIGRSFRQRLNRVLEELRQQVPDVFTREEYLRQLREQEEAGRQATQEAMSTLEQSAAQEFFLIQITASGMTISPIRENPL